MANFKYDLGDNTVLEVDREMIEYSTALPQLDPKWRGADSQGHEHAYADGADHYPSLDLILGEPYWCEDCQDEHQDSWRVCRICGEKVTPGTFVDTSVKYMPGRTQYLLNGEPISEERANVLIQAMQDRRQQ